MADTKDRTVEQMATACARYRGRGFAEYEDRGIAEAALPIAVKAVTDRVRTNHHPVEVEPSTTICADCSWQLPNGRFFGKVIEWPCPTVRLLDQIDTEMGGE